MDIDSFIAYVKTDDIYKNIGEDVETRFDTLNFELDRQLPKGKNKKVIRLIKNELGAQIMKEFVGLRAKIYTYLKDNNVEDKKAKGPKKCIIKKKKIKFLDCKNCLEAAQIKHKIKHFEKK